VDSRFVQANERTMLAWIRTGLALLTFGLVISRLGSWLGGVAPTADPSPHAPVSAFLVGAGFVALGVLVNALALVRYRRALRALDRGEPIPNDAIPLTFAILVTALGLLVAVYVLAARA
jgi:putative membrane protein